MSTATDRRPYAKVTPYTWMNGDQPTAGIVFKHGAKPFLHVTTDEARTLADRLHDMADKIDAEPVKIPAASQPATSTAEQAAAQQATRPVYTSYSAPLTAADGTPEPALPATPAE